MCENPTKFYAEDLKKMTLNYILMKYDVLYNMLPGFIGQGQCLVSALVNLATNLWDLHI